MKFSVLGREVEIRWDHLFVFLVVEISLGIVFALIGFIYSFLKGGYGTIEYNDAFASFLSAQAMILGVIATPLTAFLLLWVSEKIMKMNRDVALCRSLAGIFFILVGIVLLTVIGIPISILAGVIDAYDAPSAAAWVIASFVNSPLNAASGAILLYLWLLIFLKPEMDKLKNAAGLAVVLSFVVLIVQNLVSFMMMFASGFPFTPEIGIDTIIVLAETFMFGLPLFYHIYKEELGKEAYLFAGLYLFPLIFSTVVNSAIGKTYNLETGAISLVNRAIPLAAIYLLAKAKLK